MTTVQDCVSVFVCMYMKLMDTFKENSRQFPDVLVMMRSWNIFSGVCGEKHWYFRPNTIFSGCVGFRFFFSINIFRSDWF